MVTRHELVEYLSQVLEEGENLLVCKQVPVLDAAGEFQFHADGAMKCTWPPMKPSARNREWRDTDIPNPWYINTGVFKGPRATYEMCVAQNFILCDDVGTKCQALPLTPTWEIETSEGNFQRAYVLQTPLPPDTGAAVTRALARVGYSDPGAGTAVRWARLPGSLNLKPGRNNWQARVTQWNPDSIYTEADILAAAGTTVTEEDYVRAKVLSPVTLTNDEGDPVLAWLAEKGLVLSGAGPEGWYQVVCPNSAEHTDGDPKAKYLPSTHGYRCFHGHCDHMGSREFLAWVEAQGGPKASPGIRDDLLVEPMAAAMAALEAIRDQVRVPLFAPHQDAPAVAAAAEREQQQREAHDAAREQWGLRYAYVVRDDSYFDLEARQRIGRAQFDALYRAIPCRSRHTGRLTTASKWFDEHRAELGAVVIDNFIFAAGEGAILEDNGAVFGNLWLDRRPTVVPNPGHPAIAAWLELAERLIPTLWEREHMLDWMAFKVQHPEQKINHQVLFSSPPGFGKDTFIFPWLYAIGGLTLRNIATISVDKISASFNYHIPNEVIILNESEETAFKEKRQLENKLKDICAAPPVMLEANFKFQHPFPVRNRMAVLAMSNKDDGITLPDDDRRWLVLWAGGYKMPDDEGAQRWAQYLGGGADAIAAWLHQRDVSQFNPGRPAPWSDAKANLVHHSLSDAEESIQHMAENREGPFAHGVVGSPYTKILDLIGAALPAGVKGLHKSALLYALRRAGWINQGMIHARVGGAAHAPKRQVWTAPGVADGWSKTDIYRTLLECEGKPVGTAKLAAELKVVQGGAK